MRLMLLLLINGGKEQFIAFFVFLPTHLHGHGSNGVEDWNFNVYGNLFDQNMIIHAYGLADLGLFMKGLRYAQQILV